MKKIHVFSRESYEDHSFDSFDSKQQASDWIAAKTLENERSGTGFYVVAVIEGRAMNIDIVKASIRVKLD